MSEDENEKGKKRKKTGSIFSKLTVRDDEKVGLPPEVDVPDSCEEEARDGVLGSVF